MDTDASSTGASAPSAVVVGGGIGGLAAARALQRAGWAVQVLEQAPRLEPLGAGISLWLNAVRALADLDVRLPETSASTDVGGVRTSDGRWLSRTDASGYRARYGAPLLAVHRAELHQALLDSVAPGTVLTGVRVDGVDPRSDGVAVRHGRGTSYADLAVLADGLTSTTRHLVAGPRPRVRYAGYTAWRGVASGVDDHGLLGAPTESWGPGMRFGIVSSEVSKTRGRLTNGQ